MANTHYKDIDNNVKNPHLRDYLYKTWKPGTPVNGVAAQGTLTLSGVVIDGETITIGNDIYELCADAAQTVSGSNVAVDITSGTTGSAGTLTMDTNPTATDTVTIGTTVYTWVASGATAGEINIGVDVAASKLNLVAAINGTDGINAANTFVTAAAFAGDDMVITAIIEGTAGDLIATTETFTAGTNVFDAATLGTTVAGVDCTAANADGYIIAADVGTTYSMAQGAGTTITVTAATKGVAGDLIATTETMANGAWGQATLGDTTAGVNGTIGIAGDRYYDASYLYYASSDNTISDANWRRATGATF